MSGDRVSHERHGLGTVILAEGLDMRGRNQLKNVIENAQVDIQPELDRLAVGAAGRFRELFSLTFAQVDRLAREANALANDDTAAALSKFLESRDGATAMLKEVADIVVKDYPSVGEAITRKADVAAQRVRSLKQAVQDRAGSGGM